MSRTSDFCPNCKSVQKGLRLPDGHFVCLTCASKTEITAALTQLSFRSPSEAQPAPFRAAAVCALYLGLCIAAAAYPLTEYYHARGHNAAVFFLLTPFVLVGLLLGLLGKGHRDGVAGALLCIFSIVLVLCTAVFYEMQSPSQTPSAQRPPDLKAATRPGAGAPSTPSATVTPDPKVAGTSSGAATAPAPPAAPPPGEPAVTLQEVRARERQDREMLEEMRRRQRADAVTEQRQRVAFQQLEDVMKEYEAAVARYGELVRDAAKLDPELAALRPPLAALDTQLAMLRAQLLTLSRMRPLPDNYHELSSDTLRQIASLDTDRTALRGKLNVVEVRRANLTEQLASTDADVRKLRELLHKLSKEMTTSP